jgi:hypothetical protein
VLFRSEKGRARPTYQLLCRWEKFCKDFVKDDSPSVARKAQIRRAVGLPKHIVAPATGAQIVKALKITKADKRRVDALLQPTMPDITSETAAYRQKRQAEARQDAAFTFDRDSVNKLALITILRAVAAELNLRADAFLSGQAA